MLHFGILVFASCFNFGISIVEIKNEKRTSFKSLISKKARTWQMKRISG